MASLTATGRRWFAALLAIGLLAHGSHAATTGPTEDQVKAVFVFNFTHFVEWPTQSFAEPTQPLVIGVLGSDALAAQLSDAVRGERIDQHPLEVRRVRDLDEIGDCQILFIHRSRSAQLNQVLGAVGERGTLTVSDLDGGARRGVMIQFATESNRIRLLINLEAARAAGLTLSSKLLRPAEIVQKTN
jgi:hypothetical protein